MAAQGIQHAIGTDKYPAPQGTLMATLIKGILSFNLDWQFVLVGVFIAIVMELCGIKALSFAIGIYLAAIYYASNFYWWCNTWYCRLEKEKEKHSGITGRRRSG